MTIAKQLNAKKFPFELYDANGNVIYFETSDGFWCKSQRDSNGNVIYFEDSKGYIEDNRPKEYTHKELEQILGHKFTIK